MVSCIPNILSGSMLIFLSKGPISRIVLCPLAELALKSLQEWLVINFNIPVEIPN